MVQQVWKMCPNYKNCTCWQGHRTSVKMILIEVLDILWLNIIGDSLVYEFQDVVDTVHLHQDISHILVFLHLAAILLTTR